jgi:hypothetical protein
MANNVSTGTDPSMTRLVTGIINDAQDLIKQQLALFSHEVREDCRRTKEATFEMGIGMPILFLGGFLLALMAVHLLNAYLPFPLWGCYGIVGVGLAGIGMALCYAGKKKMESVNPLPEESVTALRENVQWIARAK